jgi:hypothetical protein
MNTSTIKRLCIILLAVATLVLTACDATPGEWKKPNMPPLTPRLQPMFEKTKTVCFGRFMVDVPVSATVAWGDTIVPLTVGIYPDGVNEVKELAQKFIGELKSEKAIYLNHIPLLISVDDVLQPEGQIVTGYEGFQAIAELKINGYFRLNNYGVVINARPLKDEKDETIADIQSIARRLRQRAETEVPIEPGNCIESAFLPDAPDGDKEHPGELLRIGFRLKEFLTLISLSKSAPPIMTIPKATRSNNSGSASEKKLSPQKRKKRLPTLSFSAKARARSMTGKPVTKCSFVRLTRRTSTRFMISG